MMNSLTLSSAPIAMNVKCGRLWGVNVDKISLQLVHVSCYLNA